MAIKRMAWQTAHYLGVITPSGETVHLLGVGVKSLSRTPSPRTVTEAYIHQRNTSSTITGYETRFTLNYDDIVDDEAIQQLLRVADDQLTGAQAEFHYYRVDLLGVPKNGAYPARRYLVACEPGDETHDATEVVSGTCVLRQIGDLTKGTFDPTTRAFTPLT